MFTNDPLPHTYQGDQKDNGQETRLMHNIRKKEKI